MKVIICILLMIPGLANSDDFKSLTEEDLSYLPVLEYEQIDFTSTKAMTRYLKFLKKDEKENYQKGGNALDHSLLEYVDYFIKAETLKGDTLQIFSFESPVDDKTFIEAFGDNIEKTGELVQKHPVYKFSFVAPKHVRSRTPQFQDGQINGIFYKNNLLICSSSKGIIKKIINTVEGKGRKFLEEDAYGDILMNLDKISNLSTIYINNHYLMMSKSKKYQKETERMKLPADSIQFIFLVDSTNISKDYVEIMRMWFFGNEKGAKAICAREQNTHNQVLKNVKARMKHSKDEIQKKSNKHTLERMNNKKHYWEDKVYYYSKKVTPKMVEMRVDLEKARQKVLDEKKAARKKKNKK